MTVRKKIQRVAIVGAGVAGLATARELLAQGLSCTLFERGPVLGGVWATGYLNFGLQVQADLYEFPDWPLPEGTPDFAPGPTVQRYLSDFADHFGITPHIRFETEVTKIARGGAEGAWGVTSRRGGQEEREVFDLVAVCIGTYSHRPNRPTFPGEESFAGEVFHVSELQRPEQLAGKRVAIVGYGKSASDAALEAAAVAKTTHLVVRSPRWPLPPFLLGVLPFKWGMLNRLTGVLIPRYQHATPVEDAIHRLGKPLVWLYWRLVEALIAAQCQLGSRFGTRLSLVPELPIEIDAFGEGTMLPRFDFYRRIRSGEIDAHRASIAAFTSTGLQLTDETELEVDAVLLATGWENDFSFFDPEVLKGLGLEDDGLYLYRHMLHPEVPNLIFMGYVTTPSDILTRSIQARWLGEWVAGRFELPEADAMQRNIEEMKRWKRGFMPFSPIRGARLMVHSLHYLDELIRDFGESPWRKTGILAPLKEVFAPYVPSDYAALTNPGRDPRPAADE